MLKKGMLIIISGPSGSGKGTVVKKLKHPNIDYALSISMTTREKRENETEGKDYFYCSQDEFINKRNNNGFLEHAVFCGNLYGTPREYVEKQIELGKTVILEIEVNGALQVRDKFPEAVLIFLLPPTMKELAFRLKNRNTDSEESIKDRLRRASDEISLIDKYDYLVINDTVEQAVSEINDIVKAEYLKPNRNMAFITKIRGDEKEC